MVKSQALTVTTTRQQVTDPDIDAVAGTLVWLAAEYPGPTYCVVGGADVTMANGVRIAPNEKVGPIRLTHGESLWVVSDNAVGIDLRVLFANT